MRRRISTVGGHKPFLSRGDAVTVDPVLLRTIRGEGAPAHPELSALAALWSLRSLGDFRILVQDRDAFDRAITVATAAFELVADGESPPLSVNQRHRLASAIEAALVPKRTPTSGDHY